jgi:putative Mg2+ transporter-C (MgtC) family protein
MFLQLTVALILGALVGLERLLAGKEAGMRTFGLVSVGACLFVLMGEEVARTYGPNINYDPMRMAASIVTGIGFLGAGLIIFQHELKGLTTAAALWVSSAVGASVGFGLYSLAAFTTFLTLFVCIGLWFVEHSIVRHVKTPTRE